MNLQIDINDYYESEKQLKRLNYFWLGFIIYTISYCLISVYPNKFITGLQLVGLVIFFPNAIRLTHFNIQDRYLRDIFILYESWALIIILRGLSFNYKFINHLIFDATNGILPYLLPFILLFPATLSFYKKLLNIIIILNVFFFMFNIIFFRNLFSNDHTGQLSQGMTENFTTYLGLPIGFLLLTFYYQSNKKKIFAIIIILITWLLVIIRARRGLVFISSSIIIFSCILFFLSSNKKILITFLGLIITFFIMTYFHQVYNSNNGIFSYLVERADEDTRNDVEIQFYKDMQLQDWIAGRGINGKYYCPEIEPEDLTGYRSVIETGYLQIILKGGLISLGLLLMIAIPAIVKGFFFSENLLAKAAAAWILIWLMSLYPTTVVNFSLNYLLFWISIGICYSKEIRNIPDTLIKYYFQN